ncbi:putative nucleic acid-binding protein [Oxalobacteraceae bacterium GrIS 2.11]
MSDFVLDASVAIRWALQDGSESDRNYAEKVLEALQNAAAWVPVLWYTETIHVLRCAEDGGKIGESAISAMVFQFAQLPIVPDPVSPIGVQLAVGSISREFKLSGYDAQYLELALRKNLPVATLDKDLRKAAKKAGVAIYLIDR